MSAQMMGVMQRSSSGPADGVDVLDEEFGERVLLQVVLAALAPAEPPRLVRADVEVAHLAEDVQVFLDPRGQEGEQVGVARAVLADLARRLGEVLVLLVLEHVLAVRDGLQQGDRLQPESAGEVEYLAELLRRERVRRDALGARPPADVVLDLPQDRVIAERSQLAKPLLQVGTRELGDVHVDVERTHRGSVLLRGLRCQGLLDGVHHLLVLRLDGRLEPVDDLAVAAD